MECFQGYIFIGTPDCFVNHCKVIIGDKTTSNGITLRLLEDKSEVIIGQDCMFSSGIYIACSDTHTITDLTGKIINIGSRVQIGHHVWVGMNAFIGKNVQISDNSVVGMCSVVTSHQKFPENCIIAGNPAKVVKENINWDRLRPKQYMNNSNLFVKKEEND